MYNLEVINSKKNVYRNTIYKITDGNLSKLPTTVLVLEAKRLAWQVRCSSDLPKTYVLTQHKTF